MSLFNTNYRDQLAAFLASEKDTRPFDDTYRRGLFAPLAVNGYTGKAEPAVPGLIHSIGDAFTAPSRAYSGELPMWQDDGKGNAITSDKAIGEALNVAGVAAGGGTVFGRVPRNAAGANALVPEAQPTGIRAYHGSPHDFDRFDLSKIGTGEGAQAYGHGLYFAEGEDVARYYRDALSKKPTLDGRPILDQRYNLTTTTGDEFLDKTLRESFGDVALARQTLEANIKSEPWKGGVGDFWEKKWSERVAGSKAALTTLNEIEQSGRLGNVSPGRMYEVNIKANPEHFLDWDKPLSQQSENVRRAVNEILASKTGKKITPEFYGSFGSSGQGINNLVSAWTKHDAGGTSQAFREAGIPGIKYLDQGSRAAGDGSRNYVVFDDKLVEILRKYGLLGPGMYGANSLFDQSPQQQ